MFRLCFLFKATFQMTDLTHLCTMPPEIATQIVVLNNVAEVCGILHNTLIYREVLCKTHSRGSMKHMESREGRI
jgi:hypothetical protein